MREYNYNMGAVCWPVRETPAALGRRFLNMAQAIAAASSEPEAWRFADESKEALLSIDEARDNMAKLIADNKFCGEDDDEPHPDAGYSMLLVNTPQITPQSLNWSAVLGGKFDQGIDFKAGFYTVPSDPAVVTYPLFKAVLLATIDSWPVRWANAYVYAEDYDKISTAPDVPPHPKSRYFLPWFSYLPGLLSQDIDLPSDIKMERTPDGGLLMIVAEDRLDPSDPEHMRRSRALAELMIERAGRWS